jgi:hypothetical protein
VPDVAVAKADGVKTMEPLAVIAVVGVQLIVFVKVPTTKVTVTLVGAL